MTPTLPRGWRKRMLEEAQLPESEWSLMPTFRAVLRAGPAHPQWFEALRFAAEIGYGRPRRRVRRSLRVRPGGVRIEATPGAEDEAADVRRAFAELSAGPPGGELQLGGVRFRFDGARVHILDSRPRRVRRVHDSRHQVEPAPAFARYVPVK